MIPATNPITLSIIIPSYNRSAFLIDLLSSMDKSGYLPFVFEVIAINNASEDIGYIEAENYKPIHYQYRYHVNQSNIGAVRNIFAGLRLARGEFCLHLPDDDSLLPEAVVEIIESMRSDPEIGATFALWQIKNIETDAVDYCYRFPDRVFASSEAADLAQMLSESEFPFPENAIYRTNIAASTIFKSDIYRYIYVLLARILLLAKISFSSKPFISMNTRVADGPPVIRASDRLSFDDYAAMSREFEVFFYWATGKRLREIREGADKSASLTCLFLSFGDAIKKRQYAGALEIACYIRSMTTREVAPPALLENLLLLANADLVIGAVRDLPLITTLCLVGYGEPMMTLFREKIDCRGLVIKSESAITATRSKSESCAYLTPSDSIRSWLVGALDIPPGHAFSMESMQTVFNWDDLAAR